MTATDELTPTARARELVRGGYDMHVHTAPDTAERIIDESAGAALPGAGAGGLPAEIALHGDRGARGGGQRRGRAAVAVVRRDRPQSRRRRAQPAAVEVAARQGARFVWLPTVDARQRDRKATRRAERQRAGVGALQRELRTQGAHRGRCRCSTRTASRCPRLLDGARGRRAPRARPRDRAPQPRRDLRRRRRGRGRGRRDHRGDQPRVPVAQARPRRPGAARRARRAAPARADDALHRQVHVGGHLRPRRARSAPRTRSGAPISGRSSTRRSRTGWPSWPTASSPPASARRRFESWQ